MKDCRACYKLSKTPELLDPDGKTPRFWWFEAFVKEKQMFFVAEDDKKVVGYVMAERTTGNIAIVQMIDVKKEYQRMEIGNALMKRIEEECKKRKLRAILLYGYAPNKKTIGFFKHEGYDEGSLTHEFLKFL